MLWFLGEMKNCPESSLPRISSVKCGSNVSINKARTGFMLAALAVVAAGCGSDNKTTSDDYPCTPEEFVACETLAKKPDLNCAETVCFSNPFHCEFNKFAAGTPCDEELKCIFGGTCDEDGQCKPATDEFTPNPDNNNEDCDDGDYCTQDFCWIGEGCKYNNLAGDFKCPDDGNPCNGDEVRVCLPADDSAGTPAKILVTCESVNPLPDGTLCNTNSDWCALESWCRHKINSKGDPIEGSNTCMTKTTMECNDNDPCTYDVCESGSCVYKISSGSIDKPCDDGDPCTINDKCTLTGFYEVTCIGEDKGNMFEPCE